MSVYRRLMPTRTTDKKVIRQTGFCANFRTPYFNMVKVGQSPRAFFFVCVDGILPDLIMDSMVKLICTL